MKLTLQVVKTSFSAVEYLTYDKPLKQMRDPVPDEETEAYTESKRVCHGDADVDITTVEGVKKFSRSTGIGESMIVYTDQTPATSGTNPKDGETIYCLCFEMYIYAKRLQCKCEALRQQFVSGLSVSPSP